MKKLNYLTLVILALGAFGCGSGGDSGDVEAAKKAAAAIPKKVEDLPSTMPPDARKGAAAGMKQAEAMQKMMNDQAAARNTAK